MRRWVASISGYKEGETPATLWGHELHRIASEWVDGTEPPYTEHGIVFETVLPYLDPEFRTGAVSEREEHFDYEGIHFKGTLDVRSFAGGEVFVDDWKTSSKPYEYGLTHLTCQIHPQGIMYPVIALLKSGGPVGVRRVHMRWRYFVSTAEKRRGSYSHTRTMTIAEGHAWNKFKRFILPRAKEMVALESLLPPLNAEGKRSLVVINSIAHNPGACELVGQFCGFELHCKMWSGLHQKEDPLMTQNAVLQQLLQSNDPDVLAQLKEMGFATDNLTPEETTGIPALAAEVNAPAPEAPKAGNPTPPPERPLLPPGARAGRPRLTPEEKAARAAATTPATAAAPAEAPPAPAPSQGVPAHAVVNNVLMTEATGLHALPAALEALKAAGISFTLTLNG